jgi:hypothetical protein
MISTYAGNRLFMLQLKQENQFWAAIGGQSPWPDENEPPAEDITANTIIEPIVYVKPQINSMVKPVLSAGDVLITDQNYIMVTDAEALEDLEARFLYLQFAFDSSIGMPVADFRQIGLFTNLIPSVGYNNAEWLIPEHVVSPGTLLRIHNDTYTHMPINRPEIVEFLLALD